MVIAGVPFSNPSDKYAAARMQTNYGKAYSFWESYSSVVQAAGRVTRGEVEDDGSFMINVAAIADGSALTPIAKGQYPAWFLDALQSGEEWTQQNCLKNTPMQSML